MPRGFQQIQEEEEEDEGGPPSASGGSPPPALTPALALTVFAATLSSLGFGYNIGVINAPQKVLEAEYNATWAQRWGSPPAPQTISLLWALSVAIFSVGGMGTALAGGALADRLGRKGALLATNGLAVVGGALMGGAKLGPTYTLIIIGRFIVGAYSGLVSVLVPLYVGEVAPLRLRGALGTLHQLGIVLGILGAQVLGLRALLGTPTAWPALFGAGLLPAALQLLLLPLCPESPRFLLARGQRGRARRGLSRLAGPAAEAGLAALEAELGRGPAPKVGLLELCRSRRYRQPLIVTLGLQLAQQLSGINAIFYYSTSIFEGAGLQDPAVGTIGTGVVNVAATALSVVLVERAGRRVLQLVGLLGMMGCAGTLGLALKLGGPVWGALALGAALAFVGFFAVGPGPLPWFVGAELFPPGPRGAALGLAGLVNWASNTAVAMAFPALQNALGPFVFLLFGGILGGFALFTFLLLPETRGRPFPGGGGPPKPVPPGAAAAPGEGHGAPVPGDPRGILNFFFFFFGGVGEVPQNSDALWGRFKGAPPPPFFFLLFFLVFFFFGCFFCFLGFFVFFPNYFKGWDFWGPPPRWVGGVILGSPPRCK